MLSLFVLLSLNLQAQCDYNLDNLSHVNCNGDNTGKIEITITNSSVTCSWLYPDGSTTNTSPIISNLYAGDYTLTLFDNSFRVKVIGCARPHSSQRLGPSHGAVCIVVAYFEDNTKGIVPILFLVVLRDNCKI